MVLLVPSVVKFAHIFENHKHEVCVDNSTTHLHSVDLDCEFYKFKTSNQLCHVFNNIDVFHTINNHDTPSSQYQFISQFQRLQFSLRGPPNNS